ncbi:molecular chaperone [Enterobacter cloacae]|uniref:fimbrial biogenesis chaperone n=1 Tax=Enterobacter cloacae TaxID=550 RepID=UPI001D026E34|nr:molecular chaperone [Enterobacter cloacae]UDG01062.1 molecular chaperone [Enterobacter cloacae]
MFTWKRLRNGTLLVIAVLLPFFNARAALVLSGTRVIFPASENQVSIKVDNPTENDYLMQSWVEDDAGKPQQDILVEPPVAQIKANHKVELRFSLVEPALKNNKSEQLFWLNVKEIPRVDASSSSSELLLAMQTKIKVFYRPAGIDPESGDAWKKLTWRRAGKNIEVNNPTPYFITIDRAMIDGHTKIDVDMVSPFSTKAVQLQGTAKVNSISWNAISDYGDVTETTSAPVR